MSSVRRVLLTIALGTAIGAGPAIAAPAMADHNHNNRSAELAALLTGRSVVQPDTADSDGWGAVNVRVRSNGRLCWSYWVRNVEDPDNINIYIGRRGNPNDDSDVVVELDGGGNFGRGCTRISRFLARQLMWRPTSFNVQVDGDDGSIRGQLFQNSNNNGNW